MTVLRFKEIDKPGNYLTKYSKNEIISKKPPKKILRILRFFASSVTGCISISTLVSLFGI